MNTQRRRLSVLILASSMLLASACGFSLRQNIQAVDVGVTYRVSVETREPTISFVVSTAMRAAGFRVVKDSADAEVRIIEEEITYDELTPDSVGAIEIRTIVYRLRFGVYGANGSTIIKSNTLEFTATSLGDADSSQTEDTYMRDSTAGLRRDAAQAIVEILNHRAAQIAERVN